jgi:hypothetical protein
VIQSSVSPDAPLPESSRFICKLFPYCRHVSPSIPGAASRRIAKYPSLYVMNVVQERRKPLSLIPPYCLTYPLKRNEHALPALGPGHITLKPIPLGQPLFLHRLLGFRLGLVRRLCRYYEAVRSPCPCVIGVRP